MSHEHDQFLVTVQQKAGISREKAEQAARATLETLAERLSGGEARDLAERLPPELAPYVRLGDAQGFAVEKILRRVAEREGVDVVLPAEEFFQRVADRVRIRPADAPRATEAVLETLAERIAGGEVADLIAQLPIELHPALRRGAARTKKASRMSLDDFVHRVAEREGIEPWKAREHVRAVFETLREAIDHREFLDVTAQLPAEYAAVGARP
jgi:uncharacterized protein (DUF2267 family)